MWKEMAPKVLIASWRFKVWHSAKKVPKTLDGLSGSCESNDLADSGCLALIWVPWPLGRNCGWDLQPKKMLLNSHFTQSLGGISQPVLSEYFKIHFRNC